MMYDVLFGFSEHHKGDKSVYCGCEGPDPGEVIVFGRGRTKGKIRM